MLMMIERWNEWIAAFDAAAADDQWDRLAPFLTDDVIYAVTGAPFSCEIRGRDAVIAGFAKSIRGFDHKFDERRWFGVGLRVWEPNAVTGRATGWYRIGDHASFTFSAQSLWLFRGDQLSIMTDVYDTSEADVQATLAVLAELGDGFDPSYI
jgi:hypothetical protein